MTSRPGSLRDYAKHRAARGLPGQTLRAIQQAIEEGRIEVDENRKIPDYAAADAQWEARTTPPVLTGKPIGPRKVEPIPMGGFLTVRTGTLTAAEIEDRDTLLCGSLRALALELARDLGGNETEILDRLTMGWNRAHRVWRDRMDSR